MVSRAHTAAGKTGPLTLKAAVERYLDWLEHSRKSAYDARRRAEAFIYDTLGDIECEALTAEMLRKWHLALSKEAPRLRTAEGKKQKHRKLDHDDNRSAAGVRPPTVS